MNVGIILDDNKKYLEDKLNYLKNLEYPEPLENAQLIIEDFSNIIEYRGSQDGNNFKLPYKLYGNFYCVLDITSYHFLIKDDILYLDLKLFLDILNRIFKRFLFLYDENGNFYGDDFEAKVIKEFDNDDNFQAYLETLKTYAGYTLVEKLDIYFKSDINFFKLDDIIEIFEIVCDIPKINYTFLTDTIIKTNVKINIIETLPYDRPQFKINKKEIFSVIWKLKNNLKKLKYSFFPKDSTFFDNTKLFNISKNGFYFLPQWLLFPTK